MIAESLVKVTLGGHEYPLTFDANAMVAYERETGKFFLDTLALLYDAITKATKAAQEAGGEKDKVRMMDIVRHVSITDLRALLWATLVFYDEHDNPHWPLTISAVGRLLEPSSIPGVFRTFLKGQRKNAPTEKEMGESGPSVETNPGVDENAEPRTVKIGGARGIDLPVGVFDSPAETPEG